MNRSNIIPLHRGIAPPLDYVAARFVPVPTPQFSGSELVTSAIVAFVSGALFTAAAAYVWSFFL